MSEKFQNKYRIESTRLRNWDYGWNAAYFVTICTKNRICWYGNAVDEKMVLNDLGKIANDCWLEIPEHFPFVKLGNHVIMPNHVHGIVVIDKLDNIVETPDSGVSTMGKTTAASKKWNPGTLGVIINQYKRAVTIGCRKIHADFAWQSRFHDHIIRNDESFHRISEYIKNNPANWSDDQYRPPL